MDILECIETRRSGRTYTDQQISRQDMEKLLALGVKAATGSNMQPWAFVVIQDKQEIDRLSQETKDFLNRNLADFPYLQQYDDWLKKDSFHVFNKAPTVLGIYGDNASHWINYDCSLAAANIMLAAHSMGIGTCWIGFAETTFQTPEFRSRHNVPDNYNLVGILGMGHAKTTLPPAKRKPPVIFDWKS